VSQSNKRRVYGDEGAPEIARDLLRPGGEGCGLEAEFVYEDLAVKGARFGGVDAGSGRLIHAVLEDVDLREARLRGVRLVDVEGTSLEGSNGDWRGGSMRRVHLSDSRLTGLVVSEAKLEEVTFRNCKLDYANFRFASLNRVSFEDCVLTETDFQGAECQSVKFSGCRMQGTDFSKAELDGVDLRGSELALSGGVEALRGAVVSTSQIIDLAMPLAEAAGIAVRDD
jgi:uncharacterized protein YjbI with pentapeptide repeats